jgi:ATP-dependent helicase HrpA
VLFRKRPPWVMAAELVETTRLWARIVARIEPEWAESLAPHLVRRSYSEPHWDAERGAVLAYEKVTLYGVVLVPARRVGYGRVNPAVSRELFIRHALVEGDWRSHHRFLQHNRELVESVRDLEDRARRRDLLVDEERIFEFYDQRVGPDVVSGRHFDSWWKAVRRSHPDLLDFPPPMLLDDDAGGLREGDFPDVWQQDGLGLRLSYRFEPGSPDDGVTVQIPLPVLNQVRADDFAWQVPGLREELLTALIRSLPKAVRRHFAPAPDHARALLSRLHPRQGPLPAALARELEAVGGVEVPEDAFDSSRVPGHLTMTFQVSDGGRVLAEGKDLDELRLRLRPRMRAAISRAAGPIERTGLRTWDLDALPRTFEHSDGGLSVRGYPALVDDGDGVAVRVVDTEAEQRRAMWAGTRRLLLLNLPSPVRAAANRLSNTAKIVLADNPHGSVGALLEDCLRCAADALIAENGGPVWDRESFGRLLEAVRGRLPETMFDVLVRTERVLAVAQEVERTLGATASPALTASLADAREQLDGLIFPGFVTATGARRLPDLVRYLRALQHRLERLPDRPARDLENVAAVHAVQEAYRDALQHLPPARRDAPDVVNVRWMLEELRVSLFAQSLRAAYPVSPKRVTAAIDALRG